MNDTATQHIPACLLLPEPGDLPDPLTRAPVLNLQPDIAVVSRPQPAPVFLVEDRPAVDRQDQVIRLDPQFLSDRVRLDGGDQHPLAVRGHRDSQLPILFLHHGNLLLWLVSPSAVTCRHWPRPRARRAMTWSAPAWRAPRTRM